MAAGGATNDNRKNIIITDRALVLHKYLIKRDGALVTGVFLPQRKKKTCAPNRILGRCPRASPPHPQYFVATKAATKSAIKTHVRLIIFMFLLPSPAGLKAIAHCCAIFHDRSPTYEKHGRVVRATRA